MKFGKEFQIHLEESLPEWRDKYLCYKPLKKLLKTVPASADSAIYHHPPSAADRLQVCFINTLNEELEKFNDFYVDKEEDFIIRFQDLKERIDLIKNKRRNGSLKSESEFSEEMMNIRKDFVSIHGEMVLLKNYSSLNFAGLVKILKKYDKRTGELLFFPFTQLALNQPFFTTEPLTRLVHECEENIELLFPLEAEVVQSVTDNNTEDQDQGVAESSENGRSKSKEESTTDIYRSTLAAMRTIQGLKKASSTYNPLSFSVLLGNHEDGSTTTESCNESLPEDGGDDDDDDDDDDITDNERVVCSPK